MIDAAGWLFLLLQIFFVDLLLGADNAIVIAMACGRLPPEETRRAVALGALGAIVLRLAMLFFANALLGVPFVKLIGAWTLVVIALNVRAQTRDGSRTSAGASPATDFVSAAVVIMLADAAMSLDNVVALAAIAGGNYWLLAIGVLMSIPIIAYGAIILTEIIDRAPEVLTIGVAFLGWIAGAMAVSDPLVAGWVQSNAPALGLIAPALVALFTLLAGKGEGDPIAAPRQAITISPTERKQWRLASRPLDAPALAATPETSADPPPKASVEDRSPEFAPSSPISARSAGWSEERVVIAGFVLLAFLAGLIIFIASFFDSLT
jgi:YjbE family integral membrane protein